MIHKIDQSAFHNRGPIQILYPGVGFSNGDTGLGSIGRIDHAKVHGNGTIPMHPHINDEIVSYFRSGKSHHRDSEGFEKFIGKERLMLMKAGKYFEHEETMLSENEPLEGLQIFIRPGQKDLKPEVVFMDLPELHSINQWRLLASPDASTNFQLSSQTWLYDMKIVGGIKMELPTTANNKLTMLLYVFNGAIKVNGEMQLMKKESLVIRDESISITTSDEAELVLFVTDEHSEIFKGGMYSGNQMK